MTHAEGRKATELQKQIDAHNAQTDAATKAAEAASLGAAMSNSRSPKDNQQVTTEYSRVPATKTQDDPTSLPNAINNSFAAGNAHPRG